MKYEAHPIANSYSQLSEEEYQALVADIHQYGQREEITLYDGKILDGRHRYNAVMDVQELGVSIEPLFKTFTGTLDEAEDYAESLNSHRRHLTYDQRVCRSVLYKKRIQQQRPQGARTDLTSCEIAPSLKGRADEIAGRKYGVGMRAVNEAEEIYDTDPDLFEMMRNREPYPGEKNPMTLREAQNRANKREKERQAQQSREAEEAAEQELMQVPDVVTGDWWRLGKHRIFCGDTSSAAFYGCVPNVAFAFADPPYNAEVAEWDKGFEWQHDWLIDKAKIVAVTPGIVSIFDFARRTSMPYLWATACVINNGMTRGALGFGNWIYTALFSHKSLHRNSQDICEVSISNKDTDETSHKGRKPAGLLVWLLNKFSEEGEIVIDPFLGSGTTLFAAHATKRVCFGGEINPQYCTEIILRWQILTGEKAVKE